MRRDRGLVGDGAPTLQPLVRAARLATGSASLGRVGLGYGDAYDVQIVEYHRGWP